MGSCISRHKRNSPQCTAASCTEAGRRGGDGRRSTPRPTLQTPLDPDDVPELRELTKFVPPVYQGKVVKVYDGDTITVGAPLTIQGITRYYKFSVRLRSIDCPEIRSSDPNEKEIAIKARDVLFKRLNNRIVHLRDLNTDKYGRLLAAVWHDDVSMSDWLIQQRLAVPYDGGTKAAISNWRTFHDNK